MLIKGRLKKIRKVKDENGTQLGERNESTRQQRKTETAKLGIE